MQDSKQIDTFQSAYSFSGKSIVLGSAYMDGTAENTCSIQIPLSTLNRHGLISGATGTGKTKSLQLMAESLSDAGVPVLLMDVKGDLSGLGAVGESNPSSIQRYRNIGKDYSPKSFPCELLSISAQDGVRMRATVSEFGPILLAKILELNDTQAGLLSLLFKYSDDQKLPLLDLKDLIRLIQFAQSEGKPVIESNYGKISSTSIGTILRKIIEIQQQGADLFFGETSFDIDDLMRVNEKGQAYISILRINDIQDKPKLFSTFMLCLLAELFAVLPEEGDMEQPKLVLFIDEAHLIFKEASAALIKQLETVIKLIRSKGVGIIFCTQNPGDIPDAILGQLGLKVQHALRAFTAADRKNIKKAAENFPLSDIYKTDELITALGMGEALITALNEKGIPTPLVHCQMLSPRSRMGVLNESEIRSIISNSGIYNRYSQSIDRESAYEILNQKLARNDNTNASSVKNNSENTDKNKETNTQSTLEEILSSPIAKQVGRTAAQVLTRSLLGALGLSSKSKKKSWF